MASKISVAGLCLSLAAPVMAQGFDRFDPYPCTKFLRLIEQSPEQARALIDGLHIGVIGALRARHKATYHVVPDLHDLIRREEFFPKLVEYCKKDPNRNSLDEAAQMLGGSDLLVHNMGH